MSSDKPSEENSSNQLPSLKSFTKATVDTANAALAGLERATRPITSSMKTIGETTESISEKMQYTFQRRHEFAPEIIGGSVFAGGAIMTLRRGRLAGIIGAAASGGAAYAIVYDQINFEHVPDILFGRK
jgi:hypothetical protein